MRQKTATLTVCALLILIMIAVNVKLTTAVTWSINERQLTTYPYYDGFPAITQTTDGKLWLVWSRSVQGNLTLYYMTSSDLGITWSEEMNLTTLPAQGNDQNPYMIQAMNGTIWVFWTSDRPIPPPPPTPDFTMNASPASLTIPLGGADKSNITVTSIDVFSEPVDLFVLEKPANVTTTLNPTRVTPPPGGSVNSTLTMSVATTATPGDYTFDVVGRSSKKSHTVSINLTITTLGGLSGLSQGTVAPAPSTSAAASSSPQDYEIFFKVSHDNGATWSRDIQLTDNSVDDLRPSVAQLRNGTILLAWQSYETGNNDIVYKTTLDGTSWSNTRQLTTYTGHDKTPSVTQTKDNKIWVTWTSNRTGDYEIFYKNYDGVSWSTDTRLTYDSADSDLNPSILQAIDSNIYIFWASMPPNGGADIYYKYSSDNGATWSASSQFTTDKNEDMWPALTQTSDTKIRVVWVSNRADQPDGNWEIWYKTSLAGDVNQDGKVDIIDLSLVGVAYGTFRGEKNYNPNADINKDGIIDVWDLSIVSLYYGET